MSEEEIIKDVKYVISIHDKKNYCAIGLKSLQGLLDLYNKEKEKNEYLTNITYVYDTYEVNNENKIIVADKEYFDNGLFVRKYVSKDKIREFIKDEYQKALFNYKLFFNANDEILKNYHLGVKTLCEEIMKKFNVY